jgi:DNA-binding cell septation regulator SpoVG
MTDNNIAQRPNYFAGQYLLEDDFELEQNYHIDRLQRHNRLLHVSGIAEGLSVTKVQGLKIRVSPGTAVDKQGKQIILHTERTVDLPGNGENTLFIKYAEKKDSPQEGTTDGYRRIVEEPAINFTASESSIALAKLTVTDREINIDESVRQYSGLRLPGAKNSEVTLRSHGNENRNLAELSGSLSISGTLAVTGESTLTGNVKANGSLTVKGNTTIEQELTVKSLRLGENGNSEVTMRSQRQENQNLADLAGSLSISGKLAVTDDTELKKTLTVKGNTTIEQQLTVKSLLLAESGNGVTLRSQRQGNQNLAVLNGSLSISETLAVIGESTLTGKVTANGSLQVAGTTQLNNTLTVKDNTTLQKDLNVSGNLKVSQAITPSPGNTVTSGIMFPKDQYGGSGDLAWIRYYQRENTVEDCTLEIGIANDAQDHIALMPNAGNVGIGTNIPKEKLEVNGNIKANGLIFSQLKGSILGNWEKLTQGVKDKTKRIERTAHTDGFVVAWIRTEENGSRGCIQVYVGGTNEEDLRGSASVQDSADTDTWVFSNSLMVPVKKNEMWRLDKTDNERYCPWQAYWISMGTV